MPYPTVPESFGAETYFALHPMIFGLIIAAFAVVMLWTVVITGFALWRSARHGQKWWFIALLVFHTLGILDLIYLLFFQKKEPAAPAPVAAPAPAESSAA